MAYTIVNPLIGVLENTKVSSHKSGLGIFTAMVFTPEANGQDEVEEDVFWRIKLQPNVVKEHNLKSRFKDKIPEWILVEFAKRIWRGAFKDNDAFRNYAFHDPENLYSNARIYRQFHRVDLNYMTLNQLVIEQPHILKGSTHRDFHTPIPTYHFHSGSHDPEP